HQVSQRLFQRGDRDQRRQLPRRQRQSLGRQPPGLARLRWGGDRARTTGRQLQRRQLTLRQRRARGGLVGGAQRAADRPPGGIGGDVVEGRHQAATSSAAVS